MDDSLKAARIIRDGGIVAFPTETVYGLGADATNELACQQIFKIKGRPSINPLIVHVTSLSEAEQIGEFNEDAFKVSTLWPGPLTIILPLKKDVKIASSVLAGLTTIGLRVPSHIVALNLIKNAGRPIAAPSANISGYISATKAEHVSKDFSGSEIFILEDNSDKIIYGLESTIIDLSGNVPILLRYGFITINVLEKLLNKRIEISSSLRQIKAPGMLEKHYSPKSLLRINAVNLLPGEVGLNYGSSKLEGKLCLNLSNKSNLAEAASNLYNMLRKLDDYVQTHNMKTIAVASIPQENIGLAINDRLQRAIKK